MLPTATIVALFASAAFICGVVHSDSRHLTAADRAGFIAECEKSATGSVANCGCVVDRLEAAGYNTVGAMRELAEHEREDAASGTLGPDSRNAGAADNACRV
jgi:hypothetical protein